MRELVFASVLRLSMIHLRMQQTKMTSHPLALDVYCTWACAPQCDKSRVTACFPLARGQWLSKYLSPFLALLLSYHLVHICCPPSTMLCARPQLSLTSVRSTRSAVPRLSKVAVRVEPEKVCSRML